MRKQEGWYKEEHMVQGQSGRLLQRCMSSRQEGGAKASHISQDSLKEQSRQCAHVCMCACVHVCMYGCVHAYWLIGWSLVISAMVVSYWRG